MGSAARADKPAAASAAMARNRKRLIGWGSIIYKNNDNSGIPASRPERNGMKVEKKKDGDLLTVFIEGTLDINTAPELKKELKGELEDVNKVVFDLKNTDYTSSAGLRVFLETFQILSKKGGTISMINVNPVFYDILKLSGFVDFLDIQRAE